MLKYMHDVKLGANRSTGLGWREYDQQFRLKKARMPSTSWGQVDQELWLIYMNNMGLPANSIQTLRKPGSSQAKCFEFNNRGRCTIPYCRYAHKCLKCDGAHAAIKCINLNSSFKGSSNFRGQTPH